MTIISTLPFNITTEGYYEIQQNFTCNISNGNAAISINCNNVVLNLNNYSIKNIAGNNTNSYGISAFDYKNIKIINGTIQGFLYGVYLSDLEGSVIFLDGGGHWIENLNVSNNFFRGIRAEGNNNLVINNKISNIGGTSFYENAYAFGIEQIGSNAIIKNNYISECRGTSTGEGVGISLSWKTGGCVVEDNIINWSSSVITNEYGPQWPASGLSTWGIWVGANDPLQILITNNKINNAKFGICYKHTASGLVAKNILNGCFIPIYLPNTQNKTKSINNITDQDGDTTLKLNRNTIGPVEYISANY